MERKEFVTVVLVLGVIALGSTTIALAFQTYFGRVPSLVFGGQLLAAAAAAGYAFWLRSRKRS